ncbi:MBL fold metallo-hydrolase [Gordonia terrae]|nr:MBL fold metallo-hydrolase [Gordonia terrae]
MSEPEAAPQLSVVTSAPVALTTGGTFSPTTATLISGPSEVALVDTLYTPRDVELLGDEIEATGKVLTTIFITHAHFDHYVGLGALLDRFPDARGVALAPVVDLIEKNMAADKTITDDWLPGNVTDYSRIPEVLDGNVFTVDGIELRAVDVGQADIEHSSVLHIPSIAAVIAGDVAYNGVHQMLGLSGPDDWQRWIDSVDRVAALSPRTVVAGHKIPGRSDDDVAAILDGTRDYISAFMHESTVASGPEALVAAMVGHFPDFANPATLHFSAMMHFQRERND